MRIANWAFLGSVCMRIAGGERESLSQRAPAEVPPSHIKPKRLQSQTFSGGSSSCSVVVIMASGVTVSDEVIKVFNEMKVRRASVGPAELSQRKKAVLFCLSEDQRTIVLEPGKEVLVGDAVPDPYAAFVALLPERDCRYALYDATYETRETKKEDLVFIFWAPDCAPLKNKMIYASSKDAVKKKMPGIKHEVQATSLEEVKDRCTLAEKLGGRSVVSLEGKPL